MIVQKNVLLYKISALVFVLPLNLPRGLLGAHVMADLLRQRGDRMQWYRDELLHMAIELGHRLLPAFNTTSGLPYPKVFHHVLLNITGPVLDVLFADEAHSRREQFPTVSTTQRNY